MREVSKDDKLFFFERSFFTLDGLWMIETENFTDFDTALEIDIVVWQRLYSTIFRRVKRYLKLENNGISDLVEILSFCWSCEGYEYEILKNEEKEAIMHITKCPYIEIMERNPERLEKIGAICEIMCIPFFEKPIKEFNSDIEIKRNEFMGTGGKVCDFQLKLLDK